MHHFRAIHCEMLAWLITPLFPPLLRNGLQAATYFRISILDHIPTLDVFSAGGSSKVTRLPSML